MGGAPVGFKLARDTGAPGCKGTWLLRAPITMMS